MAAKKAKTVTAKAYVSKAHTTRIVATSRCAIKTKNDFYYTVEAQEERTIADSDEVNMEKEWELLFDSVNAATDKQAEDILKTFNGK